MDKPSGLFEPDLPKRGDVKAGLKALAASIKRGEKLVKKTRPLIAKL